MERDYRSLRRFLDELLRAKRPPPAFPWPFLIPIAAGGLFMAVGNMTLAAVGFIGGAVAAVILDSRMRKHQPDTESRKLYEGLQQAAHSSGSQYRDKTVMGLLDDAAQDREALLDTLHSPAWGQDADDYWHDWAEKARESSSGALQEMVWASRNLYRTYSPPGSTAVENDPKYDGLRERAKSIRELKDLAIRSNPGAAPGPAAQELEDTLRRLGELKAAQEEIEGLQIRQE